MFIEMRASGYTDVSITSAYRPYSQQKYLFENYTASELKSHPGWTLERRGGSRNILGAPRNKRTSDRTLLRPAQSSVGRQTLCKRRSLLHGFVTMRGNSVLYFAIPKIKQQQQDTISSRGITASSDAITRRRSTNKGYASKNMPHSKIRSQIKKYKNHSS